MNTPVVIAIDERNGRTFRRDDLIGPGGESLVLPATRALSAVELRDVADGIYLQARGLVGYLPLTRTITLDIKPKFPMRNFWEMLKAGNAEYDRVLPVLRGYASDTVTAPHLLLLRSFCHYLVEINAIGVSKAYVQRERSGYYAPKVSFSRTLSRHLSRGQDIMASSDIFDFTKDTLPNRLLREACIWFLKIVPATKDWQTERDALYNATNALHRCSPSRARFSRKVLDELPIWLRESYAGALNIYSIALGETFAGFSYDAGGYSMPSFLFSLDTIFENFVRNTIRTIMSRHGILALDGNRMDKKPKLFLDNVFPIKPDVLLRRKKASIGIAEVKYKPKLKDADRYQLISHVVSQRVPFGLWVSPGNATTAGLEYVGRLDGGASFYHYRLDVTGDLASASADMGNAILALNDAVERGKLGAATALALKQPAGD